MSVIVPLKRPKRLKKAPWLAVVILIAAIAGYGSFDFLPKEISDLIPGNPTSAREGERATFNLCLRADQQTCVVDGDTIRYGGMIIRLADIDTPETREPKCAQEAALGKRATQRLLELMNAGPFSVVHTGGRDEDRYGRRLRVIERNGRSVGDTLIAEGLARRWDGARRSWCG